MALKWNIGALAAARCHNWITFKSGRRGAQAYLAHREAWEPIRRLRWLAIEISRGKMASAHLYDLGGWNNVMTSLLVHSQCKPVIGQIKEPLLQNL